MRDDTYALKDDSLNAEDKPLYNEAETKCLDNCVYKVFASEKLMRAYLPSRLQSLKLTENELNKRVNNPNRELGPYFYKKNFED